MRAVTLALLATCVSQAVAAADFDAGPLRGTEYAAPALVPVVNWEGGYVAAFGAVSQSNFAFRGGVSDIIATIMRNTTLEQEALISTWLRPEGKDARENSFGVIAGYNYQIDEIVLGFEIDYTRARLRGEGTDAIGRTVSTSDGYTNDVILSGTAAAELQDFATLRGRMGYTAGGFMPFITAGLALGRVKTSNSATVRVAGFDSVAYAAWAASQSTPTPLSPGTVNSYGYSFFDPNDLNGRIVGPGTTGATSKSSVAVGVAAGIGVDISITPNVFVRGEYQYIWFDDFNGFEFNVNTLRAGAGLRF
jgi:outer membrane immunogenic protein